MPDEAHAETPEPAAHAVIAREVRHMIYDFQIAPNPLVPDDPNAKTLIVLLPAEQESLVFTLTPDQQTRIHDGTAPSALTVHHPGEVPGL